MLKKMLTVFCMLLNLSATSYVFAQDSPNPILSQSKIFTSLNWEYALIGNGYGSNAKLVTPSVYDDLYYSEGLAFYSYKNYFLKTGYMISDLFGAYINIGQAEKSFTFKYNSLIISGFQPQEIEDIYLFYQQYYHLEGGCRLNISSNLYFDIGAYYGIQKGDMTLQIAYSEPMLWEKAQKGSIIEKEENGKKIHNDVGIAAAAGVLIPIIQNIVCIDVSVRLVHGLTPSFTMEKNYLYAFEWKFYNTSLGMTLGVTAVF